MEKTLVIVFDNETQALHGEQALHELDAEGSIAYFASALISKDNAGVVTLHRTIDQAPSPLAASTFVGALAGLAMGPVGALVGAAGGAMLAAMYEWVKRGGREGFLDQVARHLAPGKVAVIADVAEARVLPIETRMAAEGGLVYRVPRADAEDMLIEQELDACRAELGGLRSASMDAEGDGLATLRHRLTEAEKKLENRILDARAAITAGGRVAEARARALEERAAAADGEQREWLQSGAADVRADYERRRARLARVIDGGDQPAPVPGEQVDGGAVVPPIERADVDPIPSATE